MEKRKILSYIVAATFVIVFAWIIYNRYQLKNRFGITNAIILSVGKRMNKNGDWLVEYYYVINSNKIFSSSYLPIKMESSNELVGKSFPCAYDKNNIRNNEMLIFKHSWSQYKLMYPDSLKKFDQYFDEKKMIFSY